MTITINEENIEYVLEKEKTVGDVVNGLSHWLEQSEMLIKSLKIDGIHTPLIGSNWKNTELESVKNLSIDAVDFKEGRIIQLEAARDFFILLESSIKTGDNESLKELSSNYNDLRQILPHLLDASSNPEILTQLDAVFMESGFPNNAKAGLIDPQKTATEARKIAMLMEKRRKEIDEPENQAWVMAHALATLAENLDETAIQLQTGKDQAAMQNIIQLTEMLQAFMRSLAWIPNHKNTKEITKDMNGILTELEEALKANDTVLIGDLLEYEIKPRLIELPHTLETQ